MFRLTEWLQLAIGTVLIPFGLLFLLGGVAIIGEREEPWWVDALFVAGLGGLPFLLGLWLWRKVLRAASRRKAEAQERMILGLAAERGGQLTVQILAYESELTLSEARTALEKLHYDGHCAFEIEQDDATYTFPV
ncbi:MAG: hypothetical protein MPN21_10960 [Thermoanaerobaculia bacterium]|nr:hypothetical protein [Thermoanaerobaculia bacterium]